MVEISNRSDIITGLGALGFEMEKAGLFAFTVDQINVHLANICKRFSQDDFFDTFHEFEKHIDILPLGECSDSKDRRKRTSKLKEKNGARQKKTWFAAIYTSIFVST